MKKICFLTAGIGLFAIVACNSAEEESSQVIVKDSMGVTTGAPITNHVDSAATDTMPTVTVEPQTGNTPIPAAPAGVQVTAEKYTSATGEKITATYSNKDQMSLVTLEIKGEDPIKLMQVEAWAKGAEYSNGKTKWRSENNAATLTKDGKVTKFNVEK